MAAEPHKNAPKTRNPRSEIPVVGTNTNFVRNRQFGKGTRIDSGGARVRDTAADYPCPVCKCKMYKDEDIEFGTVMRPEGGKHTGKYHKVCPK